MATDQQLLHRSDLILRSVVRGLIVVLFLALVWFVEDRYAILSGAAVRLRVTALDLKMDANGRARLFVSFDHFVFKDDLDERLEWISAPGRPFCQPGFQRPLDLQSHTSHAWNPFNARMTVECEVNAAHPIEWPLHVGQTVRLKRGTRVMLAKFVRIDRLPGAEPKEVPDELLFVVR